MPRPKRPGGSEATYTTPASKGLVELLGGHRHEDVTLTADEMQRLRRLYGFHTEPANKRPPEPAAPPDLPPNSSYEARRAHDDATAKYRAALEAWKRWQDPRPMLQAGADRNLFRAATSDGLRLLAWLSRYCEPGGDPLKTLITMAVEAGFDVDADDLEWAEQEDHGDHKTG